MQIATSDIDPVIIVSMKKMYVFSHMPAL